MTEGRTSCSHGSRQDAFRLGLMWGLQEVGTPHRQGFSEIGVAVPTKARDNIPLEGSLIPARKGLLSVLSGETLA